MLFLFGCSKEEEKEDPTETNVPTFVGMSALETYNAAVDYFNQTVNYYMISGKIEDTNCEKEIFKNNSQINVSNKEVYEEWSSYILSYSITEGETYHALSLGDQDLYEYEVLDGYPKIMDKMYNRYDTGDAELLNIKRVNSDGKIHLTLKVKDTEDYTFGAGDGSIEDIFYTIDIVINEDALIEKETMTIYSDESFSEVLYVSTDFDFKNINQKEYEDFTDLIDEMVKCHGLSQEEVFKILKIEEML